MDMWQSTIVELLTEQRMRERRDEVERHPGPIQPSAYSYPLSLCTALSGARGNSLSLVSPESHPRGSGSPMLA